MKKYTKTLAVAFLALLMLASSALAGTVTVGWDTYIQSGTNNLATLIRVYAAPGSNVVFTANNANATVTSTTAITNTSLSLSNLYAGPWTFTATAENALGLESLNSNVVWTNVPLKGIVNLRLNSVVP